MWTFCSPVVNPLPAVYMSIQYYNDTSEPCKPCSPRKNFDCTETLQPAPPADHSVKPCQTLFGKGERRWHITVLPSVLASKSSRFASLHACTMTAPSVVASLIRTLRFAPCMYNDCTFGGSKLIHTFCFAPRMYNECKSPSVQGANSHVQRCPPIKSDSIEHT